MKPLVRLAAALVLASCTTPPQRVQLQALPSSAPLLAPTIHVTWTVRAVSELKDDDPFATSVPVSLEVDMGGRHERFELAGNAAGPFTPSCEPGTARLEFFYAGRSLAYGVELTAPGRAVVYRHTAFGDGLCETPGCNGDERAELHVLTVPPDAKISSRIVIAGDGGVQEICDGSR